MGGVCYKGCGSHSFFIHDHIYKFSRNNVVIIIQQILFILACLFFYVFICLWSIYLHDVLSITIVYDNVFDN
jgi:hypothetical protein